MNNAVSTLEATTPVVRVWDIPTRLFHWSLVVLMVGLYYTAAVKPNMSLHAKLGFVILALLLFRLVWGFIGNTYARFSQFLRGPTTVLDYVRHLLDTNHPFSPGHNPLGGWTVMVLMLAIAAQAGIGLFANDDVLFDAPLAHWVTKETSDLFTHLHAIGFKLLVAILVMHVGAVVFWHKLFMGENLITPMITGVRALPPGAHAEDAKGGSVLIAAIVFAASFALIFWALG